MTTKAREIESNPHGERKRCPICNPRPDRIRLDEVWARTRIGRKVTIGRDKGRP